MKNLLSLIITLFAVEAAAQTSVYFPFPDSNAVWNIAAQACCATDCPPPPLPNPVLVDYSFSYFLQGDTVINGTNYHKIYKSSGTAHEHCAIGGSLNNWWTFGSSYTGAMRQEISLKQVYFIQPSSGQECLLYDFSLQVGDTLVNGCSNWGLYTIVSSIDSFLIGNSYRKSFGFSMSPYTVIEGIGGTCGLTGPMFPFEYSENLICFSLNNQTLYPDTVTSCNMISQVQEIFNELSFSVSPNPFQTSTELHTGKEFLNGELAIYNALGEQVKQQPISGQTSTIERDRLDGGIYFIKVSKPGGSFVTGKLIIQ